MLCESHRDPDSVMYCLNLSLYGQVDVPGYVMSRTSSSAVECIYNHIIILCITPLGINEVCTVIIGLTTTYGYEKGLQMLQCCLQIVCLQTVCQCLPNGTVLLYLPVSIESIDAKLILPLKDANAVCTKLCTLWFLLPIVDSRHPLHSCNCMDLEY